MKLVLGIVVAVVLATCCAACAVGPSAATAAPASSVLSAEQVISTATQELLDALPHDASVWQRYVSDEAVYVSEAGDVATKKELLEGFAPFPEGISGSIQVKTVKLTSHGDFAVHVFDAYERQTVYGQQIEVNYRSTHAWHRESGVWRLIAAQNLVVPKDPAALPITANVADYVGTYDLGGKRRYRVEQRGEQLVGGREGGQLTPLIPVGENVFVDAGSNLGILRIFVRGADASVNRMVQRRKFADTTWTRVSKAAVPQ